MLTMDLATRIYRILKQPDHNYLTQVCFAINKLYVFLIKKLYIISLKGFHVGLQNNKVMNVWEK